MPQIKTQIQKLWAGYCRQSAPVRWWLGGVVLLAGIIAGGVITAYGGLLLVVLLWALCMGALALLLGTVWRIAFPGERLGEDKALLYSFAAGAVLSVAVIAALVCYRQTVYGEDAINYYAKQTLLLGSFSTNGFYGISTLAESLLVADYKMFINLFISLPYIFTNRSINAFMICYALTCFVPMWFALLMLAKKIGSWFKGLRPVLYYPLCMAAMVLWPMFLWPATHGMPDAFGLVFVAAILLLTLDYRFETLPPARLLALFAATFALVLTRRWYMFWILSYYLIYAAAVLAGAVRRKALGKTLGNMLHFGIPAVLGVVLPLALTFRTILTTDYADVYGSYYGGGFLANCVGQLQTQGVVFLLLCAAGLAVALCKKTARAPALAVTATSLLAMLLFTRTQSLGDHQSLILAPAYLGLQFCAVAALCAAQRRFVVQVGSVAAGAFFALNAANALRVPGCTVYTPLLSAESLDITRRTDLAAMRTVTDFVLQNCEQTETVYINIDTDGYSGSTFAYSDPAHPALQSMILWENSVPSTHGFPTGIWSSRYVMVTDKIEQGGLVGGVNTALRTDTPAAAHYAYVQEFALQNGVTLYCYERLAPPDAAEADYFKDLFADYDARWPALYSARIDAYLAGQ